jgi:hypothetical protein
MADGWTLKFLLLDFSASPETGSLSSSLKSTMDENCDYELQIERLSNQSTIYIDPLMALSNPTALNC